MKKNRKGIKIFIAAGLVLIAAAVAWIFSSWNSGQQAKISKADAESIAQATESAAEQIAVSEVNTRDNASGNYHVISHRGYPAKAEEHTFEGYDLAIEAGTMYIETDLVISADGTLYVSHDDSPYRMTGTGGTFSSMSDETIDALKTYGGSQILRLSDVFDRYGRTVGYAIELKDSGDDAVNAFEDIIDRYNMADNVIVQSFDAGVLETLEEKYPDMTKMFLCRTPDDRSRGLGLECADIICINKTYMNEYGLNAVHNSGKKFGVYTLDTANLIRDAINLGVDYYFTDDTALALETEKEYRQE